MSQASLERSTTVSKHIRKGSRRRPRRQTRTNDCACRILSAQFWRASGGVSSFLRPAALGSDDGALLLMDHPANFARPFPRLIWLLRNDVTNVDEQKVLLRALVTLSKGNNVLLEAQDWRLFANDQIVPGALTGVHDLAAQMGGHGILKIKIAADVVASDALGLARIVASSTTPSDGGSAARKKLTELGAKGIEFVVPEPAAASSEAPTLVVATEPPKPKEAPTAPMSAARAAEAAFAQPLP